MRIEKAEEVLGGLDATQKTRLSTYCRILSTDKDRRLFDNRISETLVQLGMKEENLDGIISYLEGMKYAQSIYEYNQIHNQLCRFTEPNFKNFSWNKNFKLAKGQLMKEVSSWQLQMTTYHGNEDVVDVIPRKDTHAGFSYLETGKRHKGEYLEDIFSVYAIGENKARKDKSFNKPIMLGSRTQASGAFDDEGERTGKFKSKTRLVSMIDIIVIIAECIFAKPFQYRMGVTSWYAGGKDDVRISDHIGRMRRRFSHSITIDYSHYDQSISDWLIREAFDIVRGAFMNDFFDEELFTIIREDFINKVFIDGNGKLVESHKGVPSGSMFTQIIDSIVNKLMITTYMLSKGVTEFDMMIMGDDNIIFSNHEIDRENLSSYLAFNFGVEVNPEKCSVALSSEDPEFLSRKWTYSGVYRNENVLVSKLLYPEHFRNYENGADPHLIIYSYYLAFPLGMRRIIDENELMSKVMPKVHLLRSSYKSLSGLMRFRLKYA